jgi:hypothetical protein
MVVAVPSQHGPGAAPGPPLAAFLTVTRDAVHDAGDFAECPAGYKALARLSAHLAAVRLVLARSGPARCGEGAAARAACLRYGRELEWVLRRLEGQLAGEASLAGPHRPAAAAALDGALRRYWAAEQALAGWLDARLTAGQAGGLARAYHRALTRAPTRPHPRSPRSGPLAGAAFWLHGRWDRLLDGLDSRPGTGRGFPVPALAGPPGPSGLPGAAPAGRGAAGTAA